MRVTRRLVAAATTTVLLGTLTACGGDEPAADQDPAPTTTAAAPESEPAEGESEDTASGEEVDAEALLADMKAAVQEQKSAHITIELAGDAEGMSGEGDVSYAGKSTAMQMRMTLPQMGEGEMQMRLVDGVMYLAMPPMTPKGKFLRLDTSDPNSPFGDLSQMVPGDPLQSFEAFDAGLQKVEHVGQEDVDGEQLEHYVLTVDAKEAAKAQGMPDDPNMPETITYDLWLDDQNLMRRIEFQQMGGSLVMTMSDWGKQVTVNAPPANALMEMPSGPPAPN
jgi:hypothetical protein